MGLRKAGGGGRFELRLWFLEVLDPNISNYMYERVFEALPASSQARGAGIGRGGMLLSTSSAGSAMTASTLHS